MTTSPGAALPLSELLRLDGQVAIVTGGGRGIGRGIVQRLAEAGATVAVVDRDLSAAHSAVEGVNQDKGNAFAIQCDVADEAQIVQAMGTILRSAKRVDVLVNNAGIYPFKPALQLSADEWDRVLHVNLRSAFLFAREFSKQVIAQGGGGNIINIGSIDAVHPTSVGLAAYDASKGGMLMFTRNFALEVAPHRIRVNMIAPGGIATEGVSAGLAGMTSEQREALSQEFMAKIPLGRMGMPDDVAQVALFLASPMSAYMTGAMLIVDGGRLLV